MITPSEVSSILFIITIVLAVINYNKIRDIRKKLSDHNEQVLQLDAVVVVVTTEMDEASARMFAIVLLAFIIAGLSILVPMGLVIWLNGLKM